MTAQTVTDAMLGQVARKQWDLFRRVKEGTLDLDEVSEALQAIIEGGFSIDCDADPFFPEGWTVEEHRRSGRMVWDPKRVSLYLSDRQRGSMMIKGNELRKELASKTVLNANVLDYLLKHPDRIPEEWKDKYVFFWGTIYRDRDGCLFVRDLFWFGDGWYWDYRWLGGAWDSEDPAVLASI